jgi:hypothetical protein
MISAFGFGVLSSLVAREEQAASAAKCERSRQAHLGLAQQYQRRLELADAVQTSTHISFGQANTAPQRSLLDQPSVVSQCS